MLCSEAAENDGAGVTEAAEEVRGAEVELEPLVEALKDRASVEVLVGR
jgi:hypothetical protein